MVTDINTGEIDEFTTSGSEYDTDVDNDSSSDDKNVLFGIQEVDGDFGTDPKMYIPRCSPKLTPSIDMVFNTFAEGEEFYRSYADLVGFMVRKGPSHKCQRSTEMKQQYFICNREGFKHVVPTLNKRKTPSNRVGCKAQICLRRKDNETYTIAHFEERHNHEMVPNFARYMQMSGRRMTIGHKKFMLSCARANLGPVKSYKVLKEMVGGYANVGALASDFKNFKRSVIEAITHSDAQMTLDMFKTRKNECSEFCYDYDVNDQGHLTRLIWCDAKARTNYAAFGDFVSFDATYRTNKYCMVFAPFTGLDNHKKCVTFAAGLLVKEDVDSYAWLFQKFIGAMKDAPMIIVTDQDPATKIAVAHELPYTRHRLCMWHIMAKVSTKVGPQKISSRTFRKKLGSLVWCVTSTIEEFEEAWETFVVEFELEDNRWFSDMYDLRSFWIEAYFREVPLGGLVRTTSISESQNSFFGSYSRRSHTLVELITQFDVAMEKQRHVQMKNDFDSITKSHDLKTPLLIEKHAQENYTLEVFIEVQSEIEKACYFCHITQETNVGDVLEYSVREGRNPTFYVKYRVEDGNTTCTCMMHVREGIPCCHIFTALKAIGVQKIPTCLLLPRWKKDAAQVVENKKLEQAIASNLRIEQRTSLASELWNAIHNCFGLVHDNEDHMLDLLDTLKRKHIEYSKNTKVPEIEDLVSSFVGVPLPVEIMVKPPEKAKNKGSGLGGRRLLGGKEKAMQEQDRKGKRKCAACGEIGTHDRRNCDKVPYILKKKAK